jgi:hypothetical protein
MRFRWWFGRRRDDEREPPRRFEDDPKVNDLQVEQRKREAEREAKWQRLFEDLKPPSREEQQAAERQEREQRRVVREAERAERRELPTFLRPGHFVRHRLDRWSEKLREREQAWHGFEALLHERGLADEYQRQKEQQAHEQQQRGQIIEHQKFLDAQQQRERDQGRGRGLSDE